MTPPQTLTEKECADLLTELRVYQGTDRQKAVGQRNYTMALLMLDAGLRVGEVVTLRIADLWYLDQPVSTLSVRTEKQKGEQTRQIPVSARLAQALSDMNAAVWSPDSTTPGCYAFYQKYPLTRLSIRTVERIIHDTGLRVTRTPIHCHMLRHTFATKALAKTNTRVTQILLGHKHLTSTQIYTHPNADDLRKAID